MPKAAVLDPQGKAVENALISKGHKQFANVRIGKCIELDFNGTDKSEAEAALHSAAKSFLVNPVIEDYRLEIDK